MRPASFIRSIEAIFSGQERDFRYTSIDAFARLMYKTLSLCSGVREASYLAGVVMSGAGQTLFKSIAVSKILKRFKIYLLLFQEQSNPSKVFAATSPESDCTEVLGTEYASLHAFVLHAQRQANRFGDERGSVRKHLQWPRPESDMLPYRLTSKPEKRFVDWR